jgi:hypothetical protein
MTESQLTKRIRKAYEDLCSALDDARESELRVTLPRIEPGEVGPDGKIARRAIKIDRSL